MNIILQRRQRFQILSYSITEISEILYLLILLFKY